MEYLKDHIRIIKGPKYYHISMLKGSLQDLDTLTVG